MPVRLPDPSTEATDGLAIDHVPPETVSDKLVLLPGHNVVVPDMTPGLASGLTVTGAVAATAPQALTIE